MADEKLNPVQGEQIRLDIPGESPAPDLTPPRRRVSRRPAGERGPSALPSSGRRKPNSRPNSTTSPLYSGRPTGFSASPPSRPLTTPKRCMKSAC